MESIEIQVITPILMAKRSGASGQEFNSNLTSGSVHGTSCPNQLAIMSLVLYKFKIPKLMVM